MARKFMISPSILGVPFTSISEVIQSIDTIPDDIIDWIHFDVMDNHFVPNLTFGHKFVSDIRKISRKIFDVHLMITEPEKEIEKYIKAGADYITFHIEATDYPDQIIKEIHLAEKKAGISIKPNTPLDNIFPYLSALDLVLIMTVEPGFGGQSLIPETLWKINTLREKIDNSQHNILIQADGGINLENINELYQRGMDCAVIGSAFFKKEDYKEAALDFRSRINENE